MSKERFFMKKRKWPWIVALVGLLLLGVAISFYVNISSTLKNMHRPIDRESSEKREAEVNFSQKDPFSVLILGVDEREGDKGRSDTMIIMTVNPSLNSTKMVSIPRDTYTEIIGHGTMDKLNHAYAFGGIEMALDSVENLFDMPIDYVVEVNMEGFQKIVDAVGGVTVQNSLAFTQDGFDFPEGKITLTGEEALSYIRMRKEDPEGDWGRQNRQRQVIQGVLNEGKSITTLLNYREIFNALGDHIKTNMSFDEMIDIQKNYRNAADTIEQLRFENGTGKRMEDNIWYYMMDEEELAEIGSLLKQHLALE